MKAIKTEAQVLAEMLDSTREFTKWYLSTLKEVDVYKEFEVDGKKFNPVIWEIGHLANSENFLGTYLTGGKSLKFNWAPLFGIGVTPPAKEEYPDYKDIWDTFKEVHENTMRHIAALTDEQLDAPSKMEFAMITDVRGAIQHCIRHEGTHIGHLGWLAKMHGVKTV